MPDFEYNDKDNSIKMNTLGTMFGSSLEDFETCMAATIDKMIELKKVSRVIFAENREYEYDWDQTKLLAEIANALDEIVKGRGLLKISNLAVPNCERHIQYRNQRMQEIILDLMRRDPIGAYVEILREIRRNTIMLRKDAYHQACYAQYLNKTLIPIQTILESTQMIQMVKDRVAGYHLGDRSLYREIFHPTIRPNFMLTRYMSLIPENARSVEKYNVGDTVVEIFRIPGKAEFLYHVTPPEFVLSDEKYALLDAARRYMGTHKPIATEFAEPERTREVFSNIGRDMIRELSGNMNVALSSKETEELTRILARYTAGFGILEVLLADERIQDVFVNSPVGQNPIYIFHSDFQECFTNLIPTREDAESWATRYRILSGRPLDEANPVLDTEMTIPGGRARICSITKTLSPEGLGFAFRRHRDKPWTLPLFMKSGMLDSMTAGLLSFLVDGSASILVAGGRGAGKTSLLNALMLEIVPSRRIVTIEDTLELATEYMRAQGYNIERLKSRSVITRVETEMSADEALRTALRLGDSCLMVGEIRSSIRGNEEVVVVENGQTNRIQIKDIEGRSLENILVPTMGPDLKMRLSKLSGFVKHPKRSKLIRIKTKTGREVTVTHDHSLFTARNFGISTIECTDLKIGDKIVIPSLMPYGYNDMDYLDVMRLMPELRVSGAENQIRKAVSVLGWKKASEICNTQDIYHYLLTTQKTNLPINSFSSLMNRADIEPDMSAIRIKTGTSNTIPAKLPMDNDFCRFLGYVISEGWTENGGVVVSNNDERIISDVVSMSRNLFSVEPYVRETVGWGISKQIRIQSTPLASLISRLGCGNGAENKRVPPIIYGLSAEKICSFLKGIYSGDGSFTSNKSSGNSVRYHTISKKLAEDVTYLLLCLGIVARIYEKRNTRTDKPIYIVEFKRHGDVKKFLETVGFVNKKIELQDVSFSNSRFNVVEFDPKELEKHLKLTRKYRHLRKSGRCGMEYLRNVAYDPNMNADDRIKTFANGNFFLDEIKEIKEIELEEPEYVYDLSVDPTQNFVGGFGGILLHNTEAKALYEAMRIGALSNVVAGTIHGESAYGVYDRVVNDLLVPPTSFKATDIILICKTLKSPDGLHRFRRVTEITEVRKHWKKDPMEERGFANLLEYSASLDKLKPTDILTSGESEVINRIASLTKEWEGKWDLVWENISTRAKIKQTMLDYSKTLNRPEILEAPWVIASNEQFHLLGSKVREELGRLDCQQLYSQWLDWFESELKKKT